MANYNFIGADGKSYGPYSAEQMREFLSQNQLIAQSQVSVDGGAWQAASSYPELAAAPQPATATPPVIGVPQPIATTPHRPVSNAAAQGSSSGLKWWIIGVSVVGIIAIGIFGIIALAAIGKNANQASTETEGAALPPAGVDPVSGIPQQGFTSTTNASFAQQTSPSIVGTYERRHPSGIMRIIFQTNGEVQMWMVPDPSIASSDLVVTQQWKLIGNEVHTSNPPYKTLIYKLNPDGSLTHVADVKNGRRIPAAIPLHFIKIR
jgi:hypothetical protein